MAEPAGFSSPMGGNLSRRASAAAAADLKMLVDLSAKYRANMEAGAKAAERTSRAARSRATVPSVEELGLGGGGGRANGGGARFTGGAAAGPPRGYPPEEDRASTNAYQVASRRQNGGAPKFGGVPAGGAGAGAASIPGLGGVDSDGVIPGGTSNGGGSRFSGITAGAGGKVLGGAKAAFGSALTIGLTSLDSYKNSDYLANRAALFGGGSFDMDRSAHNMLGWAKNSFRNDAERQSFMMPLLAGSGFTPGSSQFDKIAAASRGIAQRDPLAAATASQAQIGLASPQLFNTARMLGINTMGAGGAPVSLGNVAQQVNRMMSGSNALPSADRLSAAFGPAGRMRFQLGQMGMDQSQIGAIQNYMASSVHQGRWLGDSEAGVAGKTMFGSDQQRTSSEQGLLTSTLKEFADGYKATQKALSKSMDALAGAINHLPGALQEALFAPMGGMASIARGGHASANAIGGGLVGGLTGAATHMAGNAWRANSAARTAGQGGVLSRLGPAARAALTGGRVAAGAAGVAGVVAGNLIDDDRGGARDYAGSMLKWGATGASMGAMVGGPWGAAIGGALGLGIGAFRAHGNSGHPHGDGPGRPAATATAAWSGISGGLFMGREWGDGPGSADAQDAAQKSRGGQTVGILEELLKGFPGGARVTSTVRKGKSGVTVSGNVSYHATGNAIDVTALSPSVDSAQLLAINKYFAQYAPGLNELIYAGPGGTLVKDGQVVGPSRYGKSVMDIHHNHVHVAATASQLKKLGNKLKGGGGGIGGLFRRIAGGIASGVKSILHVGRRRPVGRGKAATATGRGASADRQAMVSAAGYSQSTLIQDLLSGMGAAANTSDTRNTGVDQGEAAPEVAGATSTRGASAAAASSVGENAVDKFLRGLRMHESGGDYNAPPHDAHHTASGAYQYLDGTWNHFGGYQHASDAPPEVQDRRARSDQLAMYGQYKNWRDVAAAHFRGSGWISNHHGGDPSWDLPVPGNGKTTVNSYVKDVLSRAGLPQTGDGPGHAPSTTVDVPEPRSFHGGASSSGGLTVHSRGGSSVTIGKVEVHLTTPQVSQAEARRIGKMVVEQIAEQTRAREVSR